MGGHVHALQAAEPGVSFPQHCMDLAQDGPVAPPWDVAQQLLVQLVLDLVAE